ncbi:MAG: hypothetical protein NTX45_25565 [Proteobacteria bacterium]|nr:hypothetical protein [Pseudomonadota bacterium]
MDVKAKDSEGRLYQIEIQLLTYRHLPERMVYTWCDEVGRNKPVCGCFRHFGDFAGNGRCTTLFRPTSEAGYALRVQTAKSPRPYFGGFGRHPPVGTEIVTAERIETEEQRWLQFFKEGEQLDEAALPDWMNTEEMRQAMKTLKLFSEKERDYHAYQARQNYLREQRTIQIEREEDHREMERIKQENERIQHNMEQAQQDLERERLEKQAALQERESALRDREAALQREQSAQAEIERLKALLAQSNQTP